MKVLNFGSLNVDYVYKVPHVIVRGETLSAKSRKVFSGGKGLNQSVALGRAGLSVYHAGCIGEDGEFLLGELRQAHVNVDFIRRLKNVPTGHTIIQNTEDGDNCIILFGGANQAVSKEFVDEVFGSFEKGDLIILQNEISNLKYIVEKAHAAEMKIALNPSPMNEVIRELPLDYIQYFFLNEIEASQITGKSADDKDGLTLGLKGCFPNAEIILTLGAGGSIYISNEQVIFQEAYKAHAVDTTAAGDTFTGYYLAAIAHGKVPTEALDFSSRAAAITVSLPGAAPSIPTWEKVLQWKKTE